MRRQNSEENPYNGRKIIKNLNVVNCWHKKYFIKKKTTPNPTQSNYQELRFFVAYCMS